MAQGNDHAELLNLLNVMQSGIGRHNGNRDDPKRVDTAETVHISSLVLIKMLKHARAGVPMEVMGLMLGKFVDHYTITVTDVFAMPQSGTSVSVESVDPIYQQNMVELLSQTGRTEMVVGWYHSHPGFGCWLSKTDVQTQQSFEALHPRAIAVVVDPIQSVRGKVMLDAFRSIPMAQLLRPDDARETTSNFGHMSKPPLFQTMAGLNMLYYALNVVYDINRDSQSILGTLDQIEWMRPILPTAIKADRRQAEMSKKMKNNLKLVTEYVVSLPKIMKLSQNERAIAYLGKKDPRRHLEDESFMLLVEALAENTKVMTAIQCFNSDKKI